MSFVFADGFDCYATVADALAGYWDSGLGVAAANTLVAGRFVGSQAFSMQANGPVAYLVKSSAINDAVHHIVCAFRQTFALSGTTLGIYFQLSDGATNQVCIVFRSDGAILLTSATPAGTVLDTYASAVTAANTWFSFEFEVVINNTTGSWAVRKNGNTSNDRALGGLNTRPGANAYANKLTVGQQGIIAAHQIDDLFWRSDASSVAWMGDIRCYTRMPASDASTQFARTSTGVLTQTVPPSTNSSVTAALAIAKCTPFVAGYSGTVTGVSVAVTTGAAGNMKCAIYADNAGNPGAVLSSATAPVNPVVTGSNVFTFSPGVTVVKGTTYWVAAITDTTSVIWTIHSSSTNSINAAASYATFPQPNPVPSATVQTTGMSWTYTATPANWQAVSEAQQDAATSYVFDSTAGDQDFYGIASIASTPVSTIAVTTRALMQKSDAGSRTAAVQLKSGATTVASPTLTLTTSGWLWAWRTDVTDPATGTAWTAAAVNGAQIGPKTVT